MKVATLSAVSSPAYIIIAYSTASYSCYCRTTYSKLMSCRLIVYGSSGVVSNDGGSNSNTDSGVGGGD